MSGRIIVLRPEPGASQTAARARQLGLEPILAPLFEVRAVPWHAPDPAAYDAVMMTSAHATRLAGSQLSRFARLPCYAVGEATAAAASEAGFGDVKAGRGDGAAVVARMVEYGVSRALHLCGREHIAVEHPRLAIDRRIVYAADAVGDLPQEALEALEDGAPALLHSPRAAARFAQIADEAGLARERVRLLAISAAAATAAGAGWASVEVADEPRDHALLELARKLCQTG